MKTGTVKEIARIQNRIFLERSPVHELLVDNVTAFRSAVLSVMLDRWHAGGFFRAV